MKRIFVTGINGLLGTNLCHELINKGFQVIGLVRFKGRYKGEYHKNLKLIEGSLFDDFSSLLRNIDVVIHAAATTDQSILKYSDYQNINCNATIQLYNTAVESKVERFIFVSTANTIGFGSLTKPGTEKNSINPLFKASYYAKSKFEAENYLLKNKQKIETVIVNPTFMLGPYDSKPSSGKIILMGWKKSFIFYPPGGKNFVHVKDVAQGIINAINYGVSGERYLLANENISYKDFFKRLNVITDQHPIMIKIPKPLLIAVGYVGSILRIFHLKTSLSKTNMKALCIGNYFSNHKSLESLNMNYQPVDKAITEAIAYFTETE